MIGSYIETAKSENFKDLAVTKLTNHELRERLLQANPDEPDIDGFVYGEQAVADAAGYRKARYFAETYLTDITTCSNLGPYVLSQHIRSGHCYLVSGQPATHLSSAAVLGDNIRVRARETRRANVSGWYKQAEMTTTIVGNSMDAAGEGPAFRLHGSDGQ